MPLVSLGVPPDTGRPDTVRPDIAGADITPPDAARPSQPVLVFSDRGRWMGLMVDEIVDVVQDRLRIQLAVDRPGILGTAVIAGAATDVIDTGHYLTQATQDWFRDGADGAAAATRLLIVEDSDFFRQLLMPTLAAAGYHVTAARDAAQALALREAGAAFDLIVSDIEMPGLDGFGFVREIRAGGAWAGLPVVALTGRARPEDEAAAREAGFTDYVVKLDRRALLVSLRRCLEAQAAAGAVR
ncbi:MAG TPA: response regulator, partial [Acetobacteraceae bacterium]|nr:response regulator [Acetobacteraceae bacterium]